MQDWEKAIRAEFPALPELPIRLVGGPAHGHVVRLPEVRFPYHQTIRVPAPRRATFVAPDEVQGSSPIAADWPVYRYDSISDVDHHWVYVWDQLDV